VIRGKRRALWASPPRIIGGSRPFRYAKRHDETVLPKTVEQVVTEFLAAKGAGCATRITPAMVAALKKKQETERAAKVVELPKIAAA
jgi:hypothetical protein